MSIPTVGINESSPAGSDLINTVDNRLREFKTQNREIIEVDHEYPSSGQSATAGQHKQVTLQEAADIGSGASGVPIFGAQTDSAGSGKPEACFTDEDDNDVFMTDDGRVGNRNLDIIGNTIDAAGGIYINGVNIIGLIYPVGAVITLGVATNPNTLFGVGTWTAIEGRVIVGKASAGTFNTLDATGGAETHTLTTDEMPAHTHTQGIVNSNSGGNAGIQRSDTANNATQTSSSTGGGSAHNNLQPYIVKYVWQRTA